MNQTNNTLGIPIRFTSNANRFSSEFNTSTKNPLDFCAAASLCPVMDDSADDILGERFAVLTVALEDATTLAIEGQGRELSAATVESLAVKIDQKLESSRQILTDINNILNRAT